MLCISSLIIIGDSDTLTLLLTLNVDAQLPELYMWNHSAYVFLDETRIPSLKIILLVQLCTIIIPGFWNLKNYALVCGIWIKVKNILVMGVLRKYSKMNSSYACMYAHIALVIGLRQNYRTQKIKPGVQPPPPIAFSSLNYTPINPVFGSLLGQNEHIKGWL